MIVAATDGNMSIANFQMYFLSIPPLRANTHFPNFISPRRDTLFANSKNHGPSKPEKSSAAFDFKSQSRGSPRATQGLPIGGTTPVSAEALRRIQGINGRIDG